MKHIKLYENFDENSEYPYYLGKGRDTGISDKSILSVFVYKSEEDDTKRLQFKMVINKKDLLFKKVSDGIEVWSKVDPGEHYKNETSVLVKSKKDSMFGGEPYRGMILKED
jgi:hypothetical protein